jgi:hypothetical protein
MGDCGADDSAGQARRAQAVRERAQGVERDLLTAVDRLRRKALPKDLPPKTTMHDYLELWNWDGTLHHAFYVELRQRDGREASPTTAIVDSQSAKGAQKGELWGKKIKGRKQHLLVDTLRLLLSVVAHPADIQLVPTRYCAKHARYSFSSSASLPTAAIAATRSLASLPIRGLEVGS